jgi:hypothetical protein
MPTDRSEAIAKYRSHDATIRSPEQSSEANRIDHYGVLGQVINEAVTRYLDSPQTMDLDKTSSHHELSSELSKAINQFIRVVMTLDEFTPHAHSLDESQYLRHFHDDAKWDRIERSIEAGTNTFVNTFEYITAALSRLGDETATHPENWRVADKIAKLNIIQFSAYYSTYLTEYQNWPAMMDHLEINTHGGVSFRPGFPNKARVNPRSLDRTKGFLTHDDFDISADSETIELADIALLEPTIGCPVTFNPENIKRLWEVYSHHVRRLRNIALEPSAGGSEASLR